MNDVGELLIQQFRAGVVFAGISPAFLSIRREITDMRIISGIMIASACGLLATSSASAQSYEITFRGTVASSGDISGIFGIAPNHDYTEDNGQPYVETFDIEPSLGMEYTEPGYLAVYGGQPYGGDAVSGSLTINSVTVRVGGSYEGIEQIGYPIVSGNPYTVVFVVAQYAAEDSGSNSLQGFVQGDFDPPTTPGATFAYTVDGTTIIDGGSSFNFQLLGADGTLIAQSVTSGPIAAVPEPSSWALMLGGVATAGGLLRGPAPRFGDGLGSRLVQSQGARKVASATAKPGRSSGFPSAEDPLVLRPGH